MEPEKRKEILRRAKEKAEKMRQVNPLIAEMAKRFDLRIDVEAEAEMDEWSVEDTVEEPATIDDK